MSASRRVEEAALRARVIALVESASPETLRTCEAVCLGHGSTGEGNQSSSGQGASRRKKMVPPAAGATDAPAVQAPAAETPQENPAPVAAAAAAGAQEAPEAGQPETPAPDPASGGDVAADHDSIEQPTQVAVPEEVQTQNEAPLADVGESVRDGDVQALMVMSYDTKFVDSVAYSTLIGNRYEHEDFTGQQVVDGVNAQFQTYIDEVASLRASGQESEADELFRWGRKFILPSYYTHSLTTEGRDPKIGVVELYSDETGVYPAVNKVMRSHDESKIGFRPFVRLLHETLTNPVPPMFRWGGLCYRWMKLPEDMVAQYDIDVYEINNYISFGGFTSASRTSEAAWWDRVQFCQDCNVLLIIKQDTNDCGPTDVSNLSRYPEEAEVMYSLGQTFRKDQKHTVSFSELCDHLSGPPVDHAYHLDFFDTGSGPVHVVYLTALDVFHQLAEDLHRGGGTADEALPLLEQRLQYEIRKGEKAKLAEAQALLTLGKAHKVAAHYEAAIGFVNRSKDIRSKIYGERHKLIAECVYQEAEIYRLQQKWDNVRPLVEQALDMRREVLEDGHPDIADSLVQKAILEDDFDRKMELYREAEQIFREATGNRHPKVARCLYKIGNALDYLKDYGGALLAYEECLSIRKKSLGDDHPDVGSVLTSIGNVYNAQDDYERALEAHKAGRAIRKKSLGDSHPDVATSIWDIGVTYENMEDFASALPAYQQAAAIYLANLGPDHEELAECVAKVGDMHKELGQMKEAKERYLEAAAIYATHDGEYRDEEEKARGFAAECDEST